MSDPDHNVPEGQQADTPAPDLKAAPTAPEPDLKAPPFTPNAPAPDLKAAPTDPASGSTTDDDTASGS